MSRRICTYALDLVGTADVGNTPGAARTGPGVNARVEDVYREYGTRVYALARRMLGNDTDAEDVAQEVLLQVVRNLDTFRGDAAVMTWLYRITVNAALAIRRKRATARERQFADAAEGGGEGAWAAGPAGELPPDASLLQTEMRARIEAAIAQLPDLYRDPFILNDVEHLSYNQIVSVLGISLAAVKSRIHRARLLMRDLLRTYFEERCAAV